MKQTMEDRIFNGTKAHPLNNGKNNVPVNMILKPGELLAGAMALYRNIGYVVIPDYGQYKYMLVFVCMKKKL